MFRLVGLLSAGLTVVLVPAALATFPGRNGRIALERSHPDCQSGRGIFSVRPGGRGLRQLTPADCSGDIRLMPVWSPDGRWILYREASVQDTPQSVVLIRGDGSDRTEVGQFNVGSYAWAPAGDRLTWDGGGVFVGPLENPRERYLTGGLWSSWSPDGRHIALAQDCGSNHDFCGRLSVVDSTTGVRVRTLARNQAVARPDWAPDGRRLVYLGTGRRERENFNSYQVYVTRRDGRRRRQLTRDPNGVQEAVWSPDGRWIAFTRAASVSDPSKKTGSDLWLMRPDGSDKHRLVKNVWDMSWQRRPKR